MPRPTAAQLAYGSATVVFSTLALLLLTRASHAMGVAAIGVASLGLGLVVAVALPFGRSGARTAKTAHTARTNHGAATSPSASAAAADGLTTRVPAARARAGAEARVGEHSLRR